MAIKTYKDENPPLPASSDAPLRVTAGMAGAAAPSRRRTERADLGAP